MFHVISFIFNLQRYLKFKIKKPPKETYNNWISKKFVNALLWDFRRKPNMTPVGTYALCWEPLHTLDTNIQQCYEQVVLSQRGF